MIIFVHFDPDRVRPGPRVVDQKALEPGFSSRTPGREKLGAFFLDFARNLRKIGYFARFFQGNRGVSRHLGKMPGGLPRVVLGFLAGSRNP